MELLILLAIILLFIGHRRLPEVGRSVGRGVREFKGELASKEAPEKRPPEAAEEEEEKGARSRAGPAQKRPLKSPQDMQRAARSKDYY
jgi:sec-independent protein translocase protein TatA